MSNRNYSPTALLNWTRDILQAEGVPLEHALTTARLLVRSDLRGVTTHGLSRLRSYIERLRAGDFNPRPNISVSRRGAALAVFGDGALGQVAGQRVVEEACKLLTQEPVISVTLRESGHLGALGLFALNAAERGHVAFLCQRTPPLLGLPGFSRRALGHNPFAFACPVAENRTPFVLDMACSVAARGHILLAAREGKSVPTEWALSPSGTETTNATEAAAGMLRPLGGYKGMAIAMMIECLAAALSASAPSNESPLMSLPTDGAMGRQSAFFLFLNPSLIDERSAFLRYMQHWIAYYRNSGGPGARIPGERGAQLEERCWREGLTFTPAIESELKEIGENTGFPMPVGVAE